MKGRKKESEMSANLLEEIDNYALKGETVQEVYTPKEKKKEEETNVFLTTGVYLKVEKPRKRTVFLVLLVIVGFLGYTYIMCKGIMS